MRRRHVLLIFIVLVGAFFSAWHLSPLREISLLVVDKTVPDSNYREHRAIFWVAEHRRFAGPDGEFACADRDYLGYHPQAAAGERLDDASLEGITLLYLADAYGVYDYEEGLEAYEMLLPQVHQDIELVYGGFDLEEAQAVGRFAAGEGRRLVGEHNIFGYPTYLEAEASALLQDLFAVRYEGWLTRYYPDLDETAFWMKELYGRLYGREWDLEGRGMVFVREDVTAKGWYTDLLVFTAADLEGPWPVVLKTGHALTGGAAQEAPYLYWLEVLALDENKTGVETLAYYQPPLKEGAYRELEARGLPRRFPAAVYYAPPGQAERVYFAGDFADQLPALLPPNLTGSAAIQRFMSAIPGIPVEYRFYFQWYEPVLKNILAAGSSEGSDE